MTSWFTSNIISLFSPEMHKLSEKEIIFFPFVIEMNKLSMLIKLTISGRACSKPFDERKTIYFMKETGVSLMVDNLILPKS